MRVVRVDFESISEADLKAVGGRNYANHPSTQVVCAVVREGDRAASVGQGWPAFPFPDLEPRSFIAVAHNANGFDRHLWARAGWPEPLAWCDTSVAMRRAGCPKASLDYGAQYYLGRKKDHDGSSLMKDLNHQLADRSGEVNLTFDFAEGVTLSTDIASRALEYCADDVDNLDGLLAALAPWFAVDAAAYETDCRIADRGICFDRELAERLLELDARLALEARRRAKVEDPRGVRSTKLFIEQMARYGVELPNAQKKTLQKAKKQLDADDPIECMAILLIEARLAGTTIAAGKLRAALNRCSPDGRMRDLTLYYGAHTGRWSGVGMQVQNLPKGVELPEIVDARLLDAITRGTWDAARKLWVMPSGKTFKEGFISPERIDELVEYRIERIKARSPGATDGLGSAHINTLTRACLMASPGHLLAVSDYSGVENRALAWAAGDEQALALMAVGADTYKAMAARIFDCDIAAVTDKQRQVGKICELGLGYQMGVKKFGLFLALEGVDLVALERDFGATPASIVKAWRDLHEPIVKFWRDMQDAAMAACRGQETTVAGRFTFRRKGKHVSCVLPSGRPIVYQHMSVVYWERRGNTMTARMPDGTWMSFTVDAEDQRKSAPGLVFMSRYGWKSLYGGLLTENAIQAFCRDLLAHSLVLCENDNMNPVAHIHDEAVCDVPANDIGPGLKKVERNMSAETAPAYAAGMPLKCEGFRCRRYRK